MRQIKFRGKCQRGYDYSDGDGWIYGSLLQKDKVYAIVKTEDIDLSPNTDDGYSFVEDFGCIPVLPDTVSQFTGLVDRNGKEIYENDIVSFPCKRRNFLVMWNDDLCVYQFSDGSLINSGDNYSAIIFVVGNAFDNPELLNEKQ